eukprot:CAMPEP_0195292260 /NCGR_PEP_ID=MMETSP0707-20130614/8764_1 /TAXON_ID=33640 /ORGANISM="Asterionellopsis glacialis, Strain CCMP134" /LENGTH=214 /DNA_ID=CAMNT_0040352667 /DNA_START=62 /DNA_END=706 /DNA_ORIENTATION=+
MSLSSLLNFDIMEIKEQGRTKPPTRLASNFRPKRLDVLSGRDKEARSHIGTKHFRQVIKNNLKRYVETQHRDEKSTVIQSIVDFIRCEAMILGGAGFVKRDLNSGRWYEIGDIQAREKVGHALRDLLKNKNAASSSVSSTSRTSLKSKSMSCIAAAAKSEEKQRKKVTFQEKSLREPKAELFLCTSSDEIDIMGFHNGFHNKEDDLGVDFSIFC